jgi:hypothetical protein
MMPIGLVERAFELAAEGSAIQEIVRRLRAEGYPHNLVAGHLRGRELLTSLRRIAANATREQSDGS